MRNFFLKISRFFLKFSETVLFLTFLFFWFSKKFPPFFWFSKISHHYFFKFPPFFWFLKNFSTFFWFQKKKCHFHEFSKNFRQFFSWIFKKFSAIFFLDSQKIPAFFPRIVKKKSHDFFFSSISKKKSRDFFLAFTKKFLPFSWIFQKIPAIFF